MTKHTHLGVVHVVWPMFPVLQVAMRRGGVSIVHDIACLMHPISNLSPPSATQAASARPLMIKGSLVEQESCERATAPSVAQRLPDTAIVHARIGSRA